MNNVSPCRKTWQIWQTNQKGGEIELVNALSFCLVIFIQTMRFMEYIISINSFLYLVPIQQTNSTYEVYVICLFYIFVKEKE